MCILETAFIGNCIIEFKDNEAPEINLKDYYGLFINGELKKLVAPIDFYDIIKYMNFYNLTNNMDGFIKALNRTCWGDFNKLNE